jgi:two-component system, response regulator
MTADPVEILLVEDTASHAEMTIHALRKDNVTNRIRVARDGIEAIDLLFAERSDPMNGPKLILLDLKLPKMDGIEVLRRIRGDVRTRHIPVVILTSSHDDRDLQVCQKLGVDRYIVKPVDFQQLTEAVCALGLSWDKMGIFWLLVSGLPA